ncbi:MAG: hypothetical protein J3Q66DRAFT_359909 [Benniella sp.]|nr:MAG: hypothetical protein J3Q66DRAFT_359909 [Benniella sp.]
MKWKLFKASLDASSPSSTSSTSSPHPPSLTPPSSASSSSISSSPTHDHTNISGTLPARKKTLFGFSTKNDSVHSLLNLAFGSNSENNLSRFSRAHNHYNSSSTTPVHPPVLPPKPVKPADSDGNDELATTTIYYHPPKPEEPTQSDGPLLEDINRELEQLSHRRAVMGHLAQARASDPAIPSARSSYAQTADHNNSTNAQYQARPSPLSGSKNRYSTQSDGRVRSGSVPTTTTTPSPSTTWVPSTPRARPHEIASLPEQYQHYLQNLQQHNHQQQQQAEAAVATAAAAPTSPNKSHEGEPGPADPTKKLRASIAGMLSPGSSFASSLVRPVTMAGSSIMALSIPCCPNNTPVVSDALDLPTAPSPSFSSLAGHPYIPPPPATVGQRNAMAAPSVLSGTARVERNTTALTPVLTQKRSPDDPSYEQLVQVVDSLNETVEDLSRKIGMMIQVGSPTATSSPRFSVAGLSHAEEMDSCISPISPISPVSYSTTRSSRDSPLLTPRHLHQQHYSSSIPSAGSPFPLGSDPMWQNESRRTNKPGNKASGAARNNSQQLQQLQQLQQQQQQQQQQLQHRRPRGTPAPYQTLPIQPTQFKLPSSPFMAPATSVPSSPSFQPAPAHPPPPVPPSPSMSRAKTKPQLYLTGSQSDDHLPLTRRPGTYHQQGSVFHSVTEEEGDDVAGYISPPLPLPSHTVIQQSHSVSSSSLVSPPRYVGQYHSLAYATTTTSSSTSMTTNTSTTNMTMTSSNSKVRAGAATTTTATTRLRSTSASATQEKVYSPSHQQLVRQRSHQPQSRPSRAFTMPIKTPMSISSPPEALPTSTAAAAATTMALSPSERAALNASQKQLDLSTMVGGPNRPSRSNNGEDLCQILAMIDQRLSTLEVEYPSLQERRLSSAASPQMAKANVTEQMKTMGELSAVERRRQSMYLNAELQAMAGKLQSELRVEGLEDVAEEVDEEMEEALKVIQGRRRTGTATRPQQQQQPRQNGTKKNTQTRQLLHEIEEIRARVLQWGGTA